MLSAESRSLHAKLSNLRRIERLSDWSQAVQIRHPLVLKCRCTRILSSLERHLLPKDLRSSPTPCVSPAGNTSRCVSSGSKTKFHPGGYTITRSCIWLTGLAACAAGGWREARYAHRYLRRVSSERPVVSSCSPSVPLGITNHAEGVSGARVGRMG
jgi:hypothetical protein